jgi:hypothetical protein
LKPPSPACSKTCRPIHALPGKWTIQ